MSLNPAEVRVDDTHIHVTPPGVSHSRHSFPIGEPGKAAAFLALTTWDYGVGYWPAKGCEGGGFDKAAFDAMLDAEVAAIKARNGWRIVATAAEYTFWGLPGLQIGESQVSDLAFQVTKGEVPGSTGGYRRLDSLVRLKGIPAGALVPAEGLATEVRAVRGPDFDGRAVWHGLLRQGEGWIPATNAAGGTIAYKDPASARVGAIVCLERDAEPEAAPTPGR